MADINQIVDISITPSGIATNTSNFQTVLIVGTYDDTSNPTVAGVNPYAALSNSFTGTYNSIQEIIDDWGNDGAVFRMANVIFQQNPRIDTVKIGAKSTNDSFSTFLQNATTVDNDWYGLIINERDLESQVDTIRWAETNKKLFFFASNRGFIVGNQPTNSDVPLIEVLGTGITHAVAFYHPSADGTQDDTRIDAAFAGSRLSFRPGSQTFHGKRVIGVQPTPLGRGAADSVNSNGFNTYTSISGTPFLSRGITISGEYIDVIRGLDWLEARIQERVFRGIATAPGKISYSNVGGAIIRTFIDQVLTEAVDNNLLTNPSIIVQSAASATPAQRAARRFPTVTFRARVVGAIHNVEIRGTVDGTGGEVISGNSQVFGLYQFLSTLDTLTPSEISAIPSDPTARRLNVVTLTAIESTLNFSVDSYLWFFVPTDLNSSSITFNLDGTAQTVTNVQDSTAADTVIRLSQPVSIDGVSFTAFRTTDELDSTSSPITLIVSST